MPALKGIDGQADRDFGAVFGVGRAQTREENALAYFGDGGNADGEIRSGLREGAGAEQVFDGLGF